MSALISIPFQSQRFAYLHQPIRNKQAAWAAKGGRGRKKPVSQAVTLLGRKRGRPKKVAPLGAKYRHGRRYAHHLDQQDRELIKRLIAIAPERPDTHIRTLICEELAHATAYPTRADDRHCRRILAKIDRDLSILRSPHGRYLSEKKGE